jgi:competence protein ComGC
MKKPSLFQKDESGEIMIESMIIVLLTTFVLIFLVSLGLLLYQKSLVTTVANETVAEVTQMYRYGGEGMDKDITSKTEMLYLIDMMPPYRYVFLGFMLEHKCGERAETYAIDRLSQTSLAALDEEPTVTVQVDNSDLGRRHVSVTVEAKYSIFWGWALKAFGMEESYVISATSYGECNDISSYYNTVRYADYLGGKLDDVLEPINAVIELFSTIFG